MMIAYKFPNLKIDAHYNRSITEDLALFVFIPNETDLEDSLNEFSKLRQINGFLKVLEQVPRPNDEIWLVDVSVWLKPEDAAKPKFFYTDVNTKQKTRDSIQFSCRNISLFFKKLYKISSLILAFRPCIGQWNSSLLYKITRKYLFNPRFRWSLLLFNRFQNV